MKITSVRVISRIGAMTIKMNTNSLSRKESKKLKKIRETKERQKSKKDLKFNDA